MAEITPAPAPEPAPVPEPAPEPTPTPEPTPEPPETGDLPEAVKDLVSKLRKEARDAEKARKAAEARAQEYEDRDKSEQEKTLERAEAAEKRAEAAETQLMRAEVAADKGVPAKLVKYLTGSTREQLEEAADELLAEIGDKQRTSFDGGVRATPPPAQSPEEAHNTTLLEALGVRSP